MSRLAVLVFGMGMAVAHAQSGRVIESEGGVTAIAFSADGGTLRGICQDGKLRVWDARSGAVRKTVAWDAGDGAATFTPDGVMTVGKEGNIKVWDTGTGAARPMPASGPMARRMASLPDGRLVTANSRLPRGSSEFIMRGWDGAGKELYAVPAGLGGLGGLAVSPDGSSVVAASYDADVRAWNAMNGELLRLIDELPVAMFDLKFSPDGKYLAAAGADRTVYLYDAKTWRLARKLEGQPEMISAIAFSGDGKLLVTGGFSELTAQNPVQVIVWDVAAGKVVRTMQAPRRVSSVALSPDGKWAAVATGDKSVALWPVPR